MPIMLGSGGKEPVWSQTECRGGGHSVCSDVVIRTGSAALCIPVVGHEALDALMRLRRSVRREQLEQRKALYTAAQ